MKNKMLQRAQKKVIIDPEESLLFVQQLAVDISEHISQFVPKILESFSIDQKEDVSRLMVHNALLGIAMGLILTNYQPELAAVAVKQMDGVDTSSADNLLESVLVCYKGYKKGGRELPPGYTQWIEISNWYLPGLWG